MESNGSTFNLKIEKSYIIAIAIALIVVSCITVGYILTRPTPTSGYHEMYLLDAQNGGNNYPAVLIANQNSSFNQQVFVTNKMTLAQDYELQVKIVRDTISFPVDATASNTIQFTLNQDESGSSQVPISMNTPGTYSVVFELYAKDNGSTANYVFTNIFCVLHVTVVAGSA
jgi:uncharacterized membrane protein